MREPQPVVVGAAKPGSRTDIQPIGTQEDHLRLYTLRRYATELGGTSPYATEAKSAIAITLSSIFALPPVGARFPSSLPPTPTRAGMERHIDNELIWLSAYLNEGELFTLANHFNTVINT